MGLGGGEHVSSNNIRTVYVPFGSFEMGSDLNDPYHAPDEIQHRVNLTRGFYVGVHEVTQAQFLDVVESNPSFFNPTNGGSLNHSVENVSSEDANLFCAILTVQERQQGAIRANEIYQLPTEAEWEYFARAGSVTRFHFSDLNECELDKSEPCP